MSPHGTDRRAVLAGVAGALATLPLAGCLDGDEDDEPEEPGVDAAEYVEGDTDPGSWADVDEIRFDGWVGGWVGVEPAAIDRVENPSLVLVEGREYELTWENMDGVHHNVALWDEDEEVVDGYSTDGNEIVGEVETLVFEATAEMDTYRCEYQQAGQVGDVILVDESDVADDPGSETD
ncbi:hypothetical protein [Natronolimnohabitans innermongolicus]|nr:hypothetical protein [Natronolimnohabitans innermongolicus]